MSLPNLGDTPSIEQATALPRDAAGSRGAARRRGRWLRRLAFVVAAAAVILAAAWIWRIPLLMAVTRAWTVDQQPGHADAIVILGGGDQYRVAKAADLFHAGVAPLVLVPQQHVRPTDELQITLAGHEVSLAMLEAKNVPRSAIQLMGTEARTTYDEACAVREWAVEHQAHRVVVPTDFFHTRRTCWIFRKQLAEVNVDVAVVAVNPDDYKMDNWWQTEQGWINFEVELSKMIFYWFNH